MSQPEFVAPDPDLCTEDEISRLVRTFYARARKDPLLGPIFDAHVVDWDAHFVQMINFWSMKLRGTSRFGCDIKWSATPIGNWWNFVRCNHQPEQNRVKLLSELKTTW
jgi:hypothetical protein